MKNVSCKIYVNGASTCKISRFNSNGSLAVDIKQSQIDFAWPPYCFVTLYKQFATTKLHILWKIYHHTLCHVLFTLSTLDVRRTAITTTQMAENMKYEVSYLRWHDASNKSGVAKHVCDNNTFLSATVIFTHILYEPGARRPCNGCKRRLHLQIK
jgi:hypothetical protein